MFERAHRRIEPTDRGAAPLGQVDRVLAKAHALIDLARTLTGPLTGAVRLGAIATLGPYYLPCVLKRVRRALPRLTLQLNEGHTASLLEQLRWGAMEAVLLALPAPGDGLSAEPLFLEPFHMVCPAEHALAGLDQTTLDEADMSYSITPCRR